MYEGIEGHTVESEFLFGAMQVVEFIIRTVYFGSRVNDKFHTFMYGRIPAEATLFDCTFYSRSGKATIGCFNADSEAVATLYFKYEEKWVDKTPEFNSVNR